jgi:hypothetical protein
MSVQQGVEIQRRIMAEMFSVPELAALAGRVDSIRRIVRAYGNHYHQHDTENPNR